VTQRPTIRLVAATAAVAAAIFAVLTAAVSAETPLGLDTHAFTVAADLRAPWLDHVARVVTTLGLLAVAGTVVVLGAAYLLYRGHLVRAVWLVAGCALTSASIWLTKALVDRPRPPDPLVHTSGQSYPSAHAGNAVGWTALAVALGVILPSRRARIAAVAAGAALTVLVGLSRIYLRAHYASDVLGGEALAVTVYALVALAALVAQRRRELTRARTEPLPPWPGRPTARR
jgi:undecaprenyl-diphosphatase